MLAEMLEQDVQDQLEMLKLDQDSYMNDGSKAPDNTDQGYKSKTFSVTKSNKVKLEDTVMQQQHLTSTQQKELLEVLQSFQSLFDGGLGKYKKYEKKSS